MEAALTQVFGRFALHPDSPLGCLAAQLIPGAQTIRYGHEELNMLMEEQNGTDAWQTHLESNLPENLTGVPLVRFFLPLIRQNLSNVTGGSESVFPLNHFARLRKLVGGLEHVLFFHLFEIIIPTYFYIFQRARATTNQEVLSTLLR